MFKKCFMFEKNLLKTYVFKTLFYGPNASQKSVDNASDRYFGGKV